MKLIAKKDTFGELYDVLFYARIILGVLLGIFSGITPMKGLPSIISACCLNLGSTFFYYTKFLKVDEDTYGATELLKEGLQPAFGAFMVVWILTYTYMGHDQ